jgi:hypothetical protein
MAFETFPLPPTVVPDPRHALLEAYVAPHVARRPLEIVCHPFSPETPIDGSPAQSITGMGNAAALGPREGDRSDTTPYR